MRALLREILDSARRSEESDGELLRRFAERRDAEAFGQLVRRYGGLVWGQCRNLLANEADADDAFQATFLVLARSAKSIRSADRLGPWLHGVAYRVCRNARRQAVRRARREQASAVPEAGRPVADSAWDTLLAAVHEELHGLPESLRVAFVLCYLEGKSTTEAAEQLGVKLGTFSSWLSRARERLLARLSARGLAAGAAVLATLAAGTAQAAPALVQRAIELAVAEAVPGVILSLTHGVLLMGITKLKVVGVCVLLAGVLAVGGLWSLHAQGPGGFPGSGAGPSGGDTGTGLPSGDPRQDIPAIQRDINRLRDLLLQKEQELRQRELEQRELARKRGQEFRYHVQQPGYAPTPAEFEKTVRENEKEGYRLVGVVNMTMDPKLPPMPGAGPGVVKLAPVPTLVFRKTPAAVGSGIGDMRTGGAGMGPGMPGPGGMAMPGTGRRPE